MDGAFGRAMAPAARGIWQVEQRVPALSALGGDGRVRCIARDADRDGGTRYQRGHDRQHRGPGTSLCSRAEKGDQEHEGLGRSRGGFTTKLHARCDGHGRPLGFVLTPGQAHDVQGFGPLFRMVADREKYRWRNLVERMFSKLKNWRRVATRYDKTRESYLGFVALASIKMWIPFVHEALFVRSTTRSTHCCGRRKLMPVSSIFGQD